MVDTKNFISINNRLRKVNESCLDGASIISEKMPDRNNVSIGITLKIGSKSDPVGKEGLFHLIEHLNFKGTKDLSARDLAIKIDELGGYIQAFTTREMTGYTATLLKDKFEEGFKLLSDIAFGSIYPEDELEKEKDILIKELEMGEDDPDEILYQATASQLWPDSRFSNPIGGKKESICCIGRSDLVNGRANHYGHSNLVISGSGAIDHDLLLDLSGSALSDIKFRSNKIAFEPILTKIDREPVLIKKDFEQIYFYLATYGISTNSQDLYSLDILNRILGGSLSSRLFSTVREQHALAYDIYSGAIYYEDRGIFYISSSTSIDKLEKLLKLINMEIKKILDFSITEDELKKAIMMEKENILMMQDSMTDRMETLADDKILSGKVITDQEKIDNYLSVSIDSVNRVFKDILKGKLQLIVTGSESKELLKIISKYDGSFV